MDAIYKKSLDMLPLSIEEALLLYEKAPLNELTSVANAIRYKHLDNNIVTWQIDRNINITNVCVSGCKFCNFHVRPIMKDKAFVTTIDEYIQKIDQTLSLGGDQILLQGGLHPALDLNYYETLFREIKKHFPQIKLHALGPPEIDHISRISKTDHKTTLQRLMAAGLESLPGAGAEILDDAVRRKISPCKCLSQTWLEVMHQAHILGLATSATMMYGHIETKRQRIEHLIKIRDLQSEKPDGSYGFINFIAWVFCKEGTILDRENVIPPYSEIEYVRTVAISRIVLNNITNIQASWLTVGIPVAQICLHAGANDLGSIMIEENVVSSAGASYRIDSSGMQKAIKDAGFTPRLRDQKYNYR